MRRHMSANLVIFNLKEAAEYLGLKPETIKYHVYVSGYLKPDKTLPRNLIFTKATLDAFREQVPTPGRKKATTQGKTKSGHGKTKPRPAAKAKKRAGKTRVKKDLTVSPLAPRAAEINRDERESTGDTDAGPNGDAGTGTTNASDPGPTRARRK